MNHKQLKLKIFIIFSIPVIALLYFSFVFVNMEYKKLQYSSAFQQSTKVTGVISQLIHNMQIERGLSSGYIGAKHNTKEKSKLLNQYQISNQAKERLMHLLDMHSDKKDALHDILGYKVKSLFKEVLKELYDLESVRDDVLNSNINFEKEVNYYTKLNKILLDLIKIFTLEFGDLNSDANAIVELQKFKEYAGLERAYVYNQLVSNHFNKKHIELIKKLQIRQLELKDNFFIDSSLETLSIYNFQRDVNLEKKLKKFREDFLEKKLSSNDAQKWFDLISAQIDTYYMVNKEILKNYNIKVIKLYQNSLNSLSITAILWALSIFALIVLLLLLRKLMNNEENFILDLDTSKNMYQLLSKINDAMIHIDNIDTLYTYFSKILYENSNSKLIWIGLVDDKQEHITHKSCAAEVIHKNFSLDFSIDKKKYSTLSLASKSILDKSIHFSDHDEIKNKPEYKNLSIFNSIHSVGAFPINNENKIIGNVVIFSDEKNVFSGEYISVVERIIDELSFAISKLSTQNQRKEDLEQLRISSYAFEAQEAMTITDITGTIIKVNKSFCEITGYTQEEVLGQNPRILQSNIHTQEFYEDMWSTLLLEGSWHGEIHNKRKNGEIFPELLSITAIRDDNNITTHYIAQFVDITKIKHAQKEAQHQADHDFLTGLLNRKYLMTRLSEEFAKGTRHNFLHAFLFIDLDNFKIINDHYGHSVGDGVIIEVADRLEYIIREGDILARISGDEFAIMLLNIDKSESEAIIDIQEVCKKILVTISDTFFICDHKINISSSIGVNFFPDSEKNIGDVIVHADRAMYQAKNQGKNQFVFFDEKLELEMKQHIQLEQEIKDAFLNDEFEFYYQAKVDSISNKIYGAELLARWQHPTKSLLFPDTFIGTTNDIGMIHEFTKLALKDAATFLKEHSDKFDGTLSINVSSNELMHQNFEKETIDFLEQNEINPKKIEFEITETDIINDFDIIINKIINLQKFGIKFSIDDFGTGYSSLTYLQKLPVNILKIDREFFLNLNIESNKELVRLMLNMAKTFNMQVIAEGIENQAQLDFIREVGIENYQGYFMSRAITKEQFIKLLEKTDN